MVERRPRRRGPIPVVAGAPQRWCSRLFAAASRLRVQKVRMTWAVRRNIESLSDSQSSMTRLLILGLGSGSWSDRGSGPQEGRSILGCQSQPLDMLASGNDGRHVGRRACVRRSCGVQRRHDAVSWRRALAVKTHRHLLMKYAHPWIRAFWAFASLEAPRAQLSPDQGKHLMSLERYGAHSNSPCGGVSATYRPKQALDYIW